MQDFRAEFQKQTAPACSGGEFGLFLVGHGNRRACFASSTDQDCDRDCWRRRRFAAWFAARGEVSRPAWPPILRRESSSPLGEQDNYFSSHDCGLLRGLVWRPAAVRICLQYFSGGAPFLNEALSQVCLRA